MSRAPGQGGMGMAGRMYRLLSVALSGAVGRRWPNTRQTGVANAAGLVLAPLLLLGLAAAAVLIAVLMVLALVVGATTLFVLVAVGAVYLYVRSWRAGRRGKRASGETGIIDVEYRRTDDAA